MKAILVVWSILVVTSQPLAYAQAKTDSMTQANKALPGGVKELDAFHELLHPLVHDAYPSKNFGAIRLALPNLIASARTLNGAVLPKELAAKKGEFKKGSAKLLKELVALNKKKLSDVEFGTRFMKMHDTFEGLMRMVE